MVQDSDGRKARASGNIFDEFLDSGRIFIVPRGAGATSLSRLTVRSTWFWGAEKRNANGRGGVQGSRG